MEFKFPVNDIFKEPVVEINQNLIPPGFSGDRRALWNTVAKVSEVINAMGEASAAAQGLTKPITTAERLRNSEQKIYLLVDQNSASGRGAVTGMLKTGKKGLYVFDRNGQHYQVSPPCVLDFYVHESRQRNGLGKLLFEHMLAKEEVHPVKMAIDRPSDKFLGFLTKHYGLNSPIKQMNNFVVFDDFFPNPTDRNGTDNDNASASPVGKKLSANGLQSYASPLGRYGAPRPACSMGQIIHNQTSTVQKNTEPVGTRSAPDNSYQQSAAHSPVNPANVSQSMPNMYNSTAQFQTQPEVVQHNPYNATLENTQAYSMNANGNLYQQVQPPFTNQGGNFYSQTSNVPLEQMPNSYATPTAPQVDYNPTFNNFGDHNMRQDFSQRNLVQNPYQQQWSNPQGNQELYVQNNELYPGQHIMPAYNQLEQPSQYVPTEVNQPVRVTEPLQPVQPKLVQPVYNQNQQPSQPTIQSRSATLPPPMNQIRNNYSAQPPIPSQPVQNASFSNVNQQYPEALPLATQNTNQQPVINASIYHQNMMQPNYSNLAIPRFPSNSVVQSQQALQQDMINPVVSQNSNFISPQHNVNMLNEDSRYGLQNNWSGQIPVNVPNTQQLSLTQQNYAPSLQNMNMNPVVPQQYADGNYTKQAVSQLNVPTTFTVGPAETKSQPNMITDKKIAEHPVGQQSYVGYQSNDSEKHAVNENGKGEVQVAEEPVNSSPKLERPRSLSIQLYEEEAENKFNDVENEVQPNESNEKIGEVVEQVEKVTLSDTHIEPPINSAEGDKSPGKKTPSHLTEQGFFDLKFYHSKLW